MSTPDTLEFFRDAALDLAEQAQANGVILTIEREPLTPLAMGNHQPKVTVYATTRTYPESTS